MNIWETINIFWVTLACNCICCSYVRYGFRVTKGNQREKV